MVQVTLRGNEPLEKALRDGSKGNLKKPEFSQMLRKMLIMSNPVSRNDLNGLNPQNVSPEACEYRTDRMV